MITIARTFALGVVSAGVIGGAAIGMAGVAGAAPIVQPSSPAPVVKAQPAPTATPGWRAHHRGHRHHHHFPPGHR
jgi:hypothetical protein